MSSKLIVEICKVDNIIKHPNADKLSLVTIKGWQCITSLDQYKIGDLVVYCPPDSIIPDDIIEKYNLEFLKKNGKVGTIKLRKFISQGLILNVPESIKNPKEGMDVAKIMGITKWTPPESKNNINNNQETLYKTYRKWRNGNISFSRFIKKSFALIKDRLFKRKKKLNPLFDKYTSINNIKNYNTIFKDGDEVIITEKLHGSNARAGYLLKKKSWFNSDKYEFCIGSHNVQLVGNRGKNSFYGEDVWGRSAEKYKLAVVLKTYPTYIFYSEVYGKGIQDLTYGLDDIQLRFFDIKDTNTGKYLDDSAFQSICKKLLLPTVPLLYKGPYSAEIVKEHTNGKSTLYKNQIREGCVIRSKEETIDPRIGRKILKSISEDYLLRKNGTEFN